MQLLSGEGALPQGQWRQIDMSAFRTIGAAMAVAAFPAVGMADTTGPTITGTRLDISARGTVTRVPDVAIISAGVVTQAADARSAMTANASAMAQVLSALRKAGVADRDMTTSQIGLSPQYRYAENRPPVVTGYQANNSVSVRFRDIAKSGVILDALVAAGANQINGPTLTLDKPQAALDEARIDAIKTARARAELYARAAGLTVKRIVAISESSDMSPPMPMMAMKARMADSAASTEIAPGEQEVGVSVSVTFELG
jgi:uncharacterized protein